MALKASVPPTVLTKYRGTGRELGGTDQGQECAVKGTLGLFVHEVLVAAFEA